MARSKPKIVWSEIKEIYSQGIDISPYLNGIFDDRQINQIKKALDSNLTAEQMEVLANPNYTWEQIEQIRLGFENGLTVRQVKFYANHNYDKVKMEEFRDALESEFIQNLTEEEFNLYTDTRFSGEQARVIRWGIECGLSVAEILSYAKPDLPWQEMENMRDELEQRIINDIAEDMEQLISKHSYNLEESSMSNKLSAKDFRMNKEMADRYVKMYKRYRKAINKLSEATPTGYLYDLYIDGLISDMGWGTDCIRGVLSFRDETYILDDWDRAKAYQKEYINKVIDMGLTKCLEESEPYELLEGESDFDKTVYAPYNILAKEFNEFWLPLLNGQGGFHDTKSSDIKSSKESISRLGFVGAFCLSLIDGIDCVLDSIAEEDDRITI